MIVLVCNCHIVYCFHMWCLPQVLYRGNKTLCSWVKEMFWDGSIVFLAPHFRIFSLFRSISRSFAETDEP
jgi:hypothetical protein